LISKGSVFFKIPTLTLTLSLPGRAREKSVRCCHNFFFLAPWSGERIEMRGRSLKFEAGGNMGCFVSLSQILRRFFGLRQ
jgi:hypothetical protein